MPDRRWKVLVVDDEPDISAITRVMLQNAGYEVITADNGLDAVREVYHSLPDCIVLDVMMPRMNGYQVCRLLKHDPRTRDIPIVLCTVKSLEMDRLYGMTTGADFYLTKPFDPGDLLRLVAEGLRKVAAAPPGERQPVPASSSTDAILTEINQLLDQKLREYTILQHVGRAISGTLNLEDLLRIILRSITTDLGYRRGIFLLLGEGDELEERLSTEEGSNRVPWKGSLAHYPGLRVILQKGAAKVVGQGEARGSIPPEIHRALNLSCVAVVPVTAKGRALGAILVECRESGGCGEDTLSFFMTLAGQAGLAVENAQLYAKTLRLSITDGLTGLFNYRYFMERLDAEFTRARRYGRDMALFILDIDHFKRFNDRFGHLKGDEALRGLAEVLGENVREVDVVARYGGEEFALILPETSMKEALVFAERLRRAVESTQRVNGLTVSLGVSVLGPAVASAEDFLRQADEALYDAKGAGRNRVCHRE